jgi:drug/metabolite transporter (DMT)-like permease
MILIGLLVGILAVSTAAIFIKLCDAPSLMIATYRLGLASLMLLPLALHQQRYQRITRSRWPSLILSGTFLSFHFATWIASLKYTSVASSVVIVSTNPVFCALISHFLLKDRISKALTWGIVLSVVGTLIVCHNDLRLSKISLYGDVLALMGALFGAGYFLLGNRIRKQTDLISYIFPVYGVCALMLVLFSVAFRVPFTGYSVRTYLFLLLLAVVPQLIGHTCFNWALRYLSAPLVALVILGEPVLSTFFAWLILGETLTWGKAMGGLLIFGGIYLAVRYAMRRELRPPLQTQKATPAINRTAGS